MSAPAMGTSKTAHTDSSHKKKKGPGTLATAYLVIYNVVMTAGWLVIAVGLVRAYLARGSYHGLYYSIEKPLKYFQTGALLEILHCAVGIVPSSVVLTGFQVMSRVFLTWAVTHSVRERKTSELKCIVLSKVKTVFSSLWWPGRSQRSSATLSTPSACSTTCLTSSNGRGEASQRLLSGLYLVEKHILCTPLFKFSQVHIFFCAVPHGSGRGTFDDLCRATIRAENRALLHHLA
uniref:Very-long-chain (3R)-3-hydroxyacyl-CoA dehydratase n=1 Tax=Cyprinus carpio TaxID=7962 RepID=A0A8C2J0Q4_CYPCA